MPEGAVYVGRPTEWGNPFWVPGKKAGRHDGIVYDLETGLPSITTRHDSVRHYRTFMAAVLANHPDYLAPLQGRDLACWCPLDQPCHADVLLELANPPTSSGTVE